MEQQNETREQGADMTPSQDATSAGPAAERDSRPTGGAAGRNGWRIGIIVLAVVAMLSVRAAMNTDSTSDLAADVAAASPQTVEQGDTSEDTSTTATAAQGPTIAGERIPSLAVLNQKAPHNNGVFLFLPGDDAEENRAIVSAINKSAVTLQGLNMSMGIFTLDAGAQEFADIARQAPPPSVLTFARGGGALIVSDDISESSLMRAFVAAASAGGGCGTTACAP